MRLWHWQPHQIRLVDMAEKFLGKISKKHLQNRPKCVILIELTADSTITIESPGVAKFGIALEWGSRGRWFESSHSDHENGLKSKDFRSFSLFLQLFCQFYVFGISDSEHFSEQNTESLRMASITPDVALRSSSCTWV